MGVQVLPIKGEADVTNACMQARRFASNLHLCTTDVSRFVTAVSELAWNIVKYAESGTCLFCTLEEDGRHIMCATFEDHGLGIPDIAAAMQDGFTTGSGLGGGLPGTKRLVDTFHIKSQPGHTVITIGLRLGKKLKNGD